MSSEPAWKVKTRPCPFYSQGRCLFSDACNFLHDVKIKAPLTVRADDGGHHIPISPKGPTISITSPRSLASPDCSPRIQSLIVALQDVIGEQEEQEERGALASEDGGDRDDESNENEGEHIQTLEIPVVPAFNPPSTPRGIARARGEMSVELLQVLALRGVVDPPTPLPTEESLTADEPEHELSDDEDPSVSIITFDYGLPEGPVEDEDTVIDNDAEDAPLAHSTPASHDSSLSSLDSPTRYAEAQQERDVLSPVQISPSNFTSMPLLSFGDFAHPSRTDSTDSGYAERWASPVHQRPLSGVFVMASPTQPATFDLLRSPFGVRAGSAPNTPAEFIPAVGNRPASMSFGAMRAFHLADAPKRVERNSAPARASSSEEATPHDKGDEAVGVNEACVEDDTNVITHSNSVLLDNTDELAYLRSPEDTTTHTFTHTLTHTATESTLDVTTAVTLEGKEIKDAHDENLTLADAADYTIEARDDLPPVEDNDDSAPLPDVLGADPTSFVALDEPVASLREDSDGHPIPLPDVFGVDATSFVVSDEGIHSPVDDANASTPLADVFGADATSFIVPDVEETDNMHEVLFETSSTHDEDISAYDMRSPPPPALYDEHIREDTHSNSSVVRDALFSPRDSLLSPRDDETGTFELEDAVNIPLPASTAASARSSPGDLARHPVLPASRTILSPPVATLAYTVDEDSGPVYGLVSPVSVGEDDTDPVYALEDTTGPVYGFSTSIDTEEVPKPVQNCASVGGDEDTGPIYGLYTQASSAEVARMVQEEVIQDEHTMSSRRSSMYSLTDETTDLLEAEIVDLHHQHVYAEPTEFFEPTELAELTEPLEPTEAFERTEHFEPTEPLGPIEPLGPSGPLEPIDPTDPVEPAPRSRPTSLRKSLASSFREQVFTPPPVPTSPSSRAGSLSRSNSLDSTFSNGSFSRPTSRASTLRGTGERVFTPPPASPIEQADSPVNTRAATLRGERIFTPPGIDRASTVNSPASSRHVSSRASVREIFTPPPAQRLSSDSSQRASPLRELFTPPPPRSPVESAPEEQSKARSLSRTSSLGSGRVFTPPPPAIRDASPTPSSSSGSIFDAPRAGERVFTPPPPPTERSYSGESQVESRPVSRASSPSVRERVFTPPPAVLQRAGSGTWSASRASSRAGSSTGEYSRTLSRAESVRERVFTPPPQLDRIHSESEIGSRSSSRASLSLRELFSPPAQTHSRTSTRGSMSLRDLFEPPSSSTHSRTSLYAQAHGPSSPRSQRSGSNSTASQRTPRKSTASLAQGVLDLASPSSSAGGSPTRRRSLASFSASAARVLDSPSRRSSTSASARGSPSKRESLASRASYASAFLERARASRVASPALSARVLSPALSSSKALSPARSRPASLTPSSRPASLVPSSRPISLARSSRPTSPTPVSRPTTPPSTTPSRPVSRMSPSATLSYVSPTSERSVSPDSASRPPSSASSFRERVFTPPQPAETPPPVRQREATPPPLGSPFQEVPSGTRPLQNTRRSTLMLNREARRMDSSASGPIEHLMHTNPNSPTTSIASSSKLRPLRLSRILTSSPSSLSQPPSSKLDSNFDTTTSPTSSASASVPSSSRNSLASLSSIRLKPIPPHLRMSLVPVDEEPPSATSSESSGQIARSASVPPDGQSRRISSIRYNPPPSAPPNAPSADIPWSSDGDATVHAHAKVSPALSRSTAPSHSHGTGSSISSLGLPSPCSPSTTRSALPTPRSTPTPLSVPAVTTAPSTPRPDLLFAIAADDPAAVRAVLEEGHVDVNSEAGPQSALAFAMTNRGLKRRVEIVRTLLAFGARTKSTAEAGAPSALLAYEEEKSVLMAEELDPATRYYVSKAEDRSAQNASALLHQSAFSPLAQVRYDLIGQDRALEQLFRVLSIQAQLPNVAPIVVLLCGPSGHGKTLVARRFGSLLGVPTHICNMINVRNGQELWQAYSTTPDEEPSTRTLAEFLIENAGKRCVVVLDEIEKIGEDKALWSLHMPWETGRVLLETGRPHVDVRNVIWLATSNIGDTLVFEHHAARSDPTAPTTRAEYVELMRLLRPKVSDRLGAPLLSRVTSVLPFVPFTEDEKLAIAAEALFKLGGETTSAMPAAIISSFAARALEGYLPEEGARSLYRAASSLLMDEL